jgi:hypothetical protein
MVHWYHASHASMLSWFLFVFDWQKGRVADGLLVTIIIVAGLECELTITLCLVSGFRMCDAYNHTCCMTSWFDA